MQMLQCTRPVSCNAFGRGMRGNNKKIINSRSANRTYSYRTNPMDILNNINSRLNHSRQTFETDRIKTITDIINTIAELSRQEMLLVHNIIEECITITFDADKDSNGDVDGSSDGTKCDADN